MNSLLLVYKLYLIECIGNIPVYSYSFFILFPKVSKFPKAFYLSEQIDQAL